MPRTIGDNAMRMLIVALRNSIYAREDAIAALEESTDDRDRLFEERELLAGLDRGDPLPDTPTPAHDLLHRAAVILNAIVASHTVRCEPEINVVEVNALVADYERYMASQ